MAAVRTLVKVEGTLLVGADDLREREVTVGIAEGEVVLSIKTVGSPDIQKQHIAASLTVSEAQRLLTGLARALETLGTQA